MATSTIALGGFWNSQRVTNADDMNSLRNSGFYHQRDTNLPANAPTDSNIYNANIIVMASNNGNLVTQFWASSNKKAVYCRWYINGTWTTWAAL